VLNRLPEDSDVPWHRVVNAQGKISDRGDGVFAGLQRQMLESEGIEFDDDSKLNLSVHQWRECD
jgi:methylated-DNA-protein-cysteine methyltransferase-like protein